MCTKHFRQRARRGARDDEIEIADYFSSSPEASRDADLEGLGALGQITFQLLCIGRDFAKLKRTGMFGAIGDRLA